MTASTESKTRKNKMCYPSFDDVRARVEDALQCFYLNDADLVHINAHERSMTFRLGMYLQLFFSDWNVDCEYNRNFCMQDYIKYLVTTPNCKKYVECKLCGKKHAGCRVFPDIIIHKRKDKENLLVIEAKIKAGEISKQSHGNKTKIKKDKDKIEEYLKSNMFEYQYGLFISFEASISDTLKELRWYRRGKDKKLQWYDNNGVMIPPENRTAKTRRTVKRKTV